jgi:hypothetical protein
MNVNGDILNCQLTGKYLLPRAGAVTGYLFMDNFVPFSSSVIRRECLQKVGLFDESLERSEDWDLLLRISVHYEFAYVDEPLLIYRLHPGQISANTERVLHNADVIMRKFLSAHPGLIPKSKIRDALTYTHLFRGYFYETINFNKSAMYYLTALKINPFALGVYRGIFRLIFRQFIIKIYVQRPV